METVRARPPRISRETRLVIVTALVALIALWGLARVRFPDASRDVTTSAMLSPLAARPAFEALASRVSTALSYTRPRLLITQLASRPGDADNGEQGYPVAWRLRDDLAVVHVADATMPLFELPAHVVTSEPSLHLAIVRVATGSVPLPSMAMVDRLDTTARYVLASERVGETVSLRPVWVSGLEPVLSQRWAATVYGLGASDLAPGDLVFGMEGEWLGLTILDGGRLAIVPGTVVVREVDDMLRRAAHPRGSLGIEVQTLDAAVGRATGSAGGVVVTWIERQSPARGTLNVGDVIETVDRASMLSADQWARFVAHLAAGANTTLGVRRQNETIDVPLTAAPFEINATSTNEDGSTPLGLTLEPVAGQGSEVTAVAAGSMASRAGLRPGDIIVWAGRTTAPQPSQVRRAAASATVERPVLIGVRRSSQHFAAALEP